MIEEHQKLWISFWMDADVHLERYKILSAAEYDCGIGGTTWNMKLYCDLMMCYECLIKSIYCYLLNIDEVKKIKDHIFYKKTIELTEINDVRLDPNVLDLIQSVQKLLPPELENKNHTNLRYYSEQLLSNDLYKSYVHLIYDHDNAESYNDKIYNLLIKLNEQWRQNIYGNF